MKNIFYWSDNDIFRTLSDSLRNNEISITSTDTILGFLGSITKKSFDKIAKIKNRDKNKPFLVILNSYDKLYKFVDSKTLENRKIKNIINNCWPGPLTIIFKAKENLPSFLQSKNNRIAIRNPKHLGLQKILNVFDGLLSTSANKSNSMIPISYDKIDSKIINQIQFLILDDQDIDTNDKLHQTLPSTIIDVSYEVVKVIRKGAYPIKDLEKIYGTKFEE